VVNTRRKTGSFRPQPTRTSACSNAVSSLSALIRSLRSRPRAYPPHNTRWLTRSGCSAAYAIATAPPWLAPSRANRSDSPHPRPS
jgi:hypothetical protein